MKTILILARERGENAGIRDAYEHDTGPADFTPTENPYRLKGAPHLYKAWSEAYENAFEERKRKR